MPSFGKVPDNDQEAQSFDMDDENFDGSSSSSRSIFDLAKTKYTYMNPKVKYGIGIAAFMLFGTILLSSGSGGKGEQAVDNSMGAGTTGSGSGTGPIIDTAPTDNSGNDGLSNKDPSSWNPTILEWDDINDIIDNLETDHEPMVFERKIFEGVTYMQKTFIFMQSNATFEDLNENGEVESEEEMGVAEQYQVEFDDIIAISDDKKRAEKNIEYMVSRLAVRSFDDQGDEIEIDSDEEYDDDEVDTFLSDIIGRKSTVKLDKYDQILDTSDEEEFLEQLQEIAPGMSAMDMYDETTRMALNLPISAKNVGDEWSLSMTVKGMDYEGSVKLMGYATYDGSKVAVFEIQSVLTIDVEDLIKEDFGDEEFNETMVENMKEDFKVKEGSMQGILFWDVQHHYPKYSMHEVTLTMEMTDPFDENELIEFPSYEVIDMYMSI